MTWIIIACGVHFTDCRWGGLVTEKQCRAALLLNSSSVPVICIAPDGEHIRSREFAGK